MFCELRWSITIGNASNHEVSTVKATKQGSLIHRSLKLSSESSHNWTVLVTKIILYKNTSAAEPLTPGMCSWKKMTSSVLQKKL